MKNITLALNLIFSLILTGNAHALDVACEPILKSIEKRIDAPSWQSSTVVNNTMKVEFLKSGTQHFMRRDSGKWTKMAVNPAEAERQFLAQARSGAIKITDCKNEGSQTVDGVNVDMLGYTIEMAGAPAVRAKLSIGKEDGLPYAQVSSGTDAHFRYKNLDTP